MKQLFWKTGDNFAITPKHLPTEEIRAGTEASISKQAINNLNSAEDSILLIMTNRVIIRNWP